MVGDPYESNSWGQRFNESGVGTFDAMRVDMISDDAFAAPWFLNWSAGGWSVSGLIGSTSVGVAGPDRTTLDFDIHFAGVSSNPLQFLFQAFDNGTLKERTKATWSGSAWSFADATSLYPDIPRAPLVVPEASSLLLLLPGLAPLGLMLRRRIGG